LGGCYEARSCRPASRASARLTACDPAALGSPTRLFRRLAGGLANALASGLACGRLLGGGPASRRLLHFPFHCPLSHLVVPLSDFYLSRCSKFESAPNKKIMCKFEDFVDIKLQFTRCDNAHSTKRVARNHQFSRVSNAVARRLHIPHPLVAKPRERNWESRALAIRATCSASCAMLCATQRAMHHAAFTTRLCKSRTAIM
jgi:hypothetical protein